MKKSEVTTIYYFLHVVGVLYDLVILVVIIGKLSFYFNYYTNSE